jgi:hypothetical protein
VALPTIDQFDCTEAFIQYISRARAYKEIGPIPPTYDGKFILVMAVALDANATDAQIAALEAAVNNLTGVADAKAMLGPAPVYLSTDIPVGYDLYLSAEAGWQLREEQV